MSIQGYFQSKGCVVAGAASGIGFSVSEALCYEREPDGIIVSAVCVGDVATGISAEGEAPAAPFPAAQIARLMLANVANKEGIIVHPEQTHKLWHDCCRTPELADTKLKEFGQQGREMALTKGG